MQDMLVTVFRKNLRIIVCVYLDDFEPVRMKENKRFLNNPIVFSFSFEGYW
jgi:hypothetical protein